MGNLHLVTGYAGRSHVTAADMASLFESLIRNGQFVMAAGSGFNAAVVTNNQIRVSDGELMMQGRHIKLDPGAYVDVTIENGEQRLLRHDLIVARYSRNAETGIEDCNLIVIKGVPAESDPADPDYITGNINAEGATENDMPLYRVVMSGLNIERLDALTDPQPSLFDTFLPKSGGTMTGSVNMNGKSIVDCMDFRSTYINCTMVRAYDFGKDNIPFMLARGGHCAHLVVGKTNSGVCAYAVGMADKGTTVEAIKICGGEYANFGFSGDATTLTIHGSSYAVCYVMSIDNWNV